MPRYCAKTSWLLAGWLLLCAFLNCAGWLLSALHQLNRAGYLLSFALGAVALFFLLWRCRVPLRPPPLNSHRLRRRFSKPFPAVFLVLAALALLGGLLHAPANYDALAYREPRVLHWLAAQQWHWIHTFFQRLNVRACGFEWLSAPVMLFTRTDRLVFVFNFISFLFMPGLVFGLFTRLGIAPRTAWHWMWLFPTGYCFLLQAGSIANDSIAAVFAAAAMDLALRARASRSVGQFWLSCLAAALLTGTKSSNIPLLMPWAIAIFPAVPLVRHHLIATLGVAVVAVSSSFLPVAILNWEHCGDWSGQAAEQALFRKDYPMLHVAQNTALIVLQNVVPPVFPMAGVWNRGVTNLIPPSLDTKLTTIFEPGAAHLNLPEMQTEETAGLGFGLSVMLFLTVCATAFVPRSSAAPARPLRSKLFLAALMGGAWLAPLPLLTVSGATTPARYLTPEYAWMIPVFLLRQSGDWTMRNAWWRHAGMVVFAIAGMLVVISPARPLWPANYVLSTLNADAHPLLARARKVYAVYGGRADGFAPVRERLPLDATTLGLVTFDDPETSLWRPFGTRRIRHVLPDDTREYLAGNGVNYILVDMDTFQQRFSTSFGQWTAGIGGQVLWKMPLILRASRAPADWCFIKLDPDAIHPAVALSTPSPSLGSCLQQLN
jgi:hypothetical protein